MSKEQTEMYAIHLRLEEIGRKLRTGDVVPPEKDRSPSPPPTYGPDGKRSNTRDVRYKKKLEDERHRLVDRAMKLDPNWRPPSDYKKPTKIQDKVWIPAREFPEINFIGLLIGPRGNTLKKLETETGAKVSIRGKGSVKEGRSRADGGLAPGEEEELHCLITADSEDKVVKAVKMIEKTIETAASVPEGQNELKRLQLRELAALNGTLRDDENQVCQNCGGLGHRKYDCPETRNVTINLICRICNNAGHIARDCMHKDDPQFQQQAREREKELDTEYTKFMSELSGPGGGGGGPGGAAKSSLPWANQGAAALPWKSSGPAPGSMPPPPGFGSDTPPPGMSMSGPAMAPPPGMVGYWPGGNPGFAPPPGMGAPGGYAPGWGAPPPPPPSFQVGFSVWGSWRSRV
ncbi:eukaryotic type KH-domain (KH-domain type I) [Gonapodya prolifera JEL478]|uniref:Branchpoint-bridging protein n=1 Tax=Gonapodya prolifera (strain JEL478) TaxID=1344416 RepID=A0A139AZQ8_GONPJ|nr:eukaryotic type KH-domain (KH-domain type I) [Gonapodya prolifera JEL478]|eukprot:KXS22228.1 eukaryotic type KH-domain (KH-domain type I) [Gonapodya prolifera JEL478]